MGPSIAATGIAAAGAATGISGALTICMALHERRRGDISDGYKKGGAEAAK
jgi:hypothetical protein